MFTLAHAEELVDEIEIELKKLGIEIKPGSALEHACLQCTDRIHKRANLANLDLYEDPRENERYLVGIHFLFSKIKKAIVSGKVNPFVEHLKLLSTAQPVQTVVHPPHDESNKLFELFVGLAASECFDSVEMAPPYGNDTSNPDVLAILGKQTWGFACKVPHSSNPRSAFDNLAKGVDQIERSRATTGCVIMNLKMLFDHNSINEKSDDAPPKYKGFLNPASVERIVKSSCETTLKAVLASADRSEKDAVFQGKKALRGVLGYVQSCALIGNPPIVTGQSCSLLLSDSKVAFSIAQLDLLMARLGHLERPSPILIPPEIKAF